MARGSGRKSIPTQNRNIPAVPKWTPQPKSFRPASGEDCVRVRLSHLDVEGPFCLTGIEQDHFVDLLKRVKSFESMTRAELFAPGSEEGKEYPAADLPCKAALDRLVELELDDQTKIARLRVSGERRLYGFLWEDRPDFWALWWDPEHQIWPSEKKNT